MLTKKRFIWNSGIFIRKQGTHPSSEIIMRWLCRSELFCNSDYTFLSFWKAYERSTRLLYQLLKMNIPNVVKLILTIISTWVIGSWLVHSANQSKRLIYILVDILTGRISRPLIGTETRLLLLYQRVQPIGNRANKIYRHEWTLVF